jgi:transcriptional regulator with XRE-family HTH domain
MKIMITKISCDMIFVKPALFRPYTGCVMPRVSKLKLPPMDTGSETLGQRLARIRKERGFTQIELAEKIGIIQSLVSSYENDVLQLKAEMAVRFARALEISIDELLEPKKGKRQSVKPSRKVLRRLELIESLPIHQQQTVLKTIDAMLKGLKSAS